jgi:hypothetical protein
MNRLRRLYTWFLRVLVSWLMLTGFLPRPLLLVWLEWLHECLSPHHPAMDLVLVEIATVRERASCAPGYCEGKETCLDTACQNHPDQPHNRWGLGMHRIVPMHRNDPAPTDDSGHPVGWAVLLFAIACAIAWVFIRVKLNLPF